MIPYSLIGNVIVHDCGFTTGLLLGLHPGRASFASTVTAMKGVKSLTGAKWNE